MVITKSKKEWFIFTRSPEGLDIESGSKLFTISLLIAGISSAIRYGVYQWLQSLSYSVYCNSEFEDCSVGIDLAESIIEGIMVVIFHLILYYVVQLAYSDNMDTKSVAKREIGYIAQLWILADLLYLAHTLVFLQNTNGDNYWSNLGLYWFLWSTVTVLSIFYIAGPIIERLKESFQEYNNILGAAFFLSLLIYWASYGLSWVVRIMLLLPF